MNKTKTKEQIPDPAPLMPEHSRAQTEERNLIAQAADEDPIIRFFYENQKVLSYLVIAALVSILGYRWYQSTHAAGQQRSAELFSKAGAAYQDITNDKLDPTRQEAAQRKFEGAVTTLSSQSHPYPLMARNYQTMLLVKDKKYADAASALKSLKWAAQDPKQPQVLWNELLALNLTKSLLEQPDYQQEAWKVLKSLAGESYYVQVPAISTWKSLIAAGKFPDSAETLKSLTSQLRSQKPELGKVLDQL